MASLTTRPDPEIPSEHLSTFQRDGFLRVEALLPATTLVRLRAALAALSPAHRRRSPQATSFAARNLLQHCPAVALAARSGSLQRWASAALGAPARPVKATLFDKRSGANWKVPWHQDRAIAVRRRVDVAGFTGWSVKVGVPHVRPPREVLEKMVALRLHLDPCGAGAGPLRVVPGSHREGLLQGSGTSRLVASRPAHLCIAGAGDVLLMRPLLLHASSAATAPSRRRVLHIEYTAADLPGGLEWA